MKYYLGVDTSCYTTSLAIVDSNGAIVADKRRLLSVPLGKNGLAQSDMVFQHTKNLPDLWCEIMDETCNLSPIVAVSVSGYPRRIANSYMPAFVPGISMARLISRTYDVPLHILSHQEGHVWAAKSSENNIGNKFKAVHLSGGTCEILQVFIANNSNLRCEILSSSSDITAGQMIDRLGVKLGLAFPCGYEMDQLANTTIDKFDSKLSFKPSILEDGRVSFSGYTSAFERRFAENDHYATSENLANNCRDILEFLGCSLGKWLKIHVDCGETILMCGGVTASICLRSLLSKKLANQYNMLWAPSALSSDNAVGAALMAMHSTC